MTSTKLFSVVVKTWVVSLVILFISFDFFGQINPAIDSVSRVILTSENRIEELSTAYKYFQNNDLDGGIVLTKYLIPKLVDLEDYEAAAMAAWYCGRHLTSKENTDSVNHYLQKSIELAKKSNSPKTILYLNRKYITHASTIHQDIKVDSFVNENLNILANSMELTTDEKGLEKAGMYKAAGYYAISMNQDSEALEYLDLCVQELSVLDTSLAEVKDKQAHLYFSIAYQFYKSGYDGRSKKLLLEAADMLNGISSYGNASDCYTLLGAIYKREEKYDSALYYFQSAYEINSRFNLTSKKAGSLENMGIVYKDLNQFDKALESFEESLAIRQKLNRPNLLIGLYTNMSNVFIQQKKYDKAEKYLLDALKLSEGVKGIENVVVITYQNLAELYNLKGDYKQAYNYYVKHKQLDDSLTSLQLQQEQLAFDKKLEISEKNAKIKLTNEQNKVLAIKNEKQKNRLIALIIGIIALGILLIVIYLLGQQKRKNQKLLFEKEQEVKQNEVLKLLGANEISNMNSFMQGQEKERSRIASDLHDRLGSLLSTVKLHFGTLQMSLEETNMEHSELLNKSIELLDKSVDEVRSVSHNLTKGVITQFGLLAAVETIQEAINATGRMQMQVVDTGFEKRLESEVEINLFRVIQEMVTNAIKHADAKEMIIQFVQNEDAINIIVEDDGKGFDSSTLNSDGIGLQNMYNRINEIGASYNLDTKPGFGTTYIIELKT